MVSAADLISLLGLIFENREGKVVDGVAEIFIT
jgi:hypothetical protein